MSEGNIKKRDANDAFDEQTVGKTSRDEPRHKFQEEEDEERICRFCFEGENDSSGRLIAPCACKGGQKYIHLECLRQWQRMVLVSQPTHPDFWEDDVRHKVCNVCKADFTCPPPTRQELVEGFTGPEIAALIEPGCIIASHEGFNRIVAEQLSANPLVALFSSCRHWFRGAYLITKVEEDTGQIEYPVQEKCDVENLLERLDDELCLQIHDGSKYKLQLEGSLSDYILSDDTENKSELRKRIHIPSQLVFRPMIPVNCVDDKVAAVNLTRTFVPPAGTALSSVVSQIIKDCKAETIDVTYYWGGPCFDDMIVTCLVLGGRRTGYTLVHRDFKTALLLAKRNARTARLDGRNNIAIGQDVVLDGLRKRPDLNGKRGLVQAYDEQQGRFEVRLFEVEVKEQEDVDRNKQDAEERSRVQLHQAGRVDIVRVKPENLVAHSSGIGKHGKVMAFVGDARWTRAQLLGEIAKASWGLCRVQTSDILVPAEERYDKVFSRLVYAPESEMSEDHGRNMATLRRGAIEAAQYAQGGE